MSTITAAVPQQRIAGYVPPPLIDEPLDGYVEYLAHRLTLRPGLVREHLGVPYGGPFGAAQGISDQVAAQVAAVTGWSVDEVHAMTLRRYAAVGLMPITGVTGGGPGPWMRRKGARFCPACLRERDGRWRLSWYLQWTYICTEHAVLLDVVCPRCGRPPRTRRSGHPRIDPPAPTGRDAGQSTTPATPSCVCSVPTLASADLHRSGPEALLDRPVPAIFKSCQRDVTDRITNRRTVLYLGTERPSIEWIHDLAALTRLLAVNAPHDHIPQSYTEVLLAADSAEPHSDATTEVPNLLGQWQEHWSLTPYTAPAPRFTEAGASRVVFPVLATVAASVLRGSEQERTTELLARLFTADTRRAATKASSRRGISWSLANALWPTTARARRSRTRTVRISSERFRPDGSERVPLAPARIAARPFLSVRTILRWTGETPFVGLGVTAALLTVATSRPLREACDLVDHGHHARRMINENRWLFAAVSDALGNDALTDLLAVHEALTAGDVPIDYQRRRRIFTRPVPLAQRTAIRAARELDHRPTPRLTRFMSWWIYEQLSGNDVLLGRELLELPGAIRSIYARQRNQWDADPPPVLLRRAEHALLVNRIDEPISWAPAYDEDSGTWTCPTPNRDRQLDWSNRPRRSHARPAQPINRGLNLTETLILARSGQSRETDRLARLLARFHAVADAPTVAIAAARLDMSQAALSRDISTLETELDTGLFTRTHQANVLTSKGEQLHRLLRIKPITHIDPRRDPRRHGGVHPLQQPEGRPPS